MGPILEQVRCASLPLSALPGLAGLRRDPGITITVVDGRAWVRWEPGAPEVLRRVLPVAGVELFVRREGRWYRPGDHLPTFGVPEDGEGEAFPLARAIFPRPVEAVPPDVRAHAPARLGLVRDDRARPSTALRCGLAELGPWAESAPTARLSALSAARSGDRVMLLGRGLPAIVGSERFWGSLVLAPLGFRADPDLPEPALRRALGVGDGDGEILLLLEDGSVEIIPRDAFRPLTRAGVRLASGEAPR